MLDPAVESTTLDNGLQVTTVALPHLHTAVCALFVKVGSRFELAGDNGLSHFVEHMLFRGTERYPTSLALNTAVEELGSTLHAETGPNYSLFQLALEPVLCAERLRQRVATRHPRDYTRIAAGLSEWARRAKASGGRRRSQPADEEISEQIRDRLGVSGD